jgi:hypothetical protein
LFKKSRPQVRPYEQKDNGFLWAAYLAKSFALPEGLTQEEFLVEISKQLSYPLLWVVEDDCRGFKSGRGVVAVVGLLTDGWVFEPKAHFFKWARPRTYLRVAVAFLQMMRHQEEVGVCVVRTLKKDFAFMKHLQKYGVLYLRGRIQKGSPQGDVFIFSVDGKKQ